MKNRPPQPSASDCPDSLNPNFLYSLTHDSLLLDIAAGRLDPVLLARRELAGRGLDRDGNWVGFQAAERIHGVEVK